MNGSYRYHSENTAEYKEGYISEARNGYGIDSKNPYESGTKRWMDFNIGAEDAKKDCLNWMCGDDNSLKWKTEIFDHETIRDMLNQVKKMFDEYEY